MDPPARPDVFHRHAHNVPEDARRTPFRSGHIAFSHCSKLYWADDEATPNLPLCTRCFPGRTDKWR